MDNDLVKLWDDLERFALDRGGKLIRYKDRMGFELYDGLVWLTVGRSPHYSIQLAVRDAGPSAFASHGGGSVETSGETFRFLAALETIGGLEFFLRAAMNELRREENWVPRYQFDPGVLSDPAVITDRHGNAMARPAPMAMEDQIEFVTDFLDGAGAQVIEVDVAGMALPLAQVLAKRRPDLTIVGHSPVKLRPELLIGNR